MVRAGAIAGTAATVFRPELRKNKDLERSTDLKKRGLALDRDGGLAFPASCGGRIVAEIEFLDHMCRLGPAEQKTLRFGAVFGLQAAQLLIASRRPRRW